VYRNRAAARHHRRLRAGRRRASPEFAKLFATYQRIKASYVEPVEDEKLIRGAIDGMLAALDPHSAYLDGAAGAAGDDDRRQYQGLGISVQMDDGAVKVVSPFRGSPADGRDQGGRLSSPTSTAS
jgi:carboxyl-terminal processing protease